MIYILSRIVVEGTGLSCNIFSVKTVVNVVMICT